MAHSPSLHFAHMGALLPLLLVAQAACAADVLVVTARPHVVQVPAGVRVIDLDAAERIETEITAGLPKEPERAEALIRQRLTHGGAALQQRLATAHQGVVDAWSLGVQKVPAVVVDKRYVVYGETDVARAVARIAQHRERRP
uniref:TIGR03757 family integrating conjugative element protein n=1 Tax=Collimonas silvisoli TaxID=2825884 RepID=UPI0038B3A61E